MLFVIYNVDPVEQKFALFRLALREPFGGAQRYPLLYLRLGDTALFAVEAEVSVRAVDLSGEPEEKVGARRVSRGDALRREAAIKRLPRAKKLRLVEKKEVL